MTQAKNWRALKARPEVGSDFHQVERAAFVAMVARLRKPASVKHTLKKPASKRPSDLVQILHVSQTGRFVVRSSMRHLLNGCIKRVWHPDRFTLSPWQQTSRKIPRRTTIACCAKAASSVSSEKGGKAMLCTRVDR